MDNNTNIVDAISRGFVDHTITSKEDVRTKFLVNNRKEKLTVIDSITRELEQCASFTFSVAFITKDGLPEIKCLLLDLKDKGLRGRIITSDYLMFNDPEMFRELLKFENVDVRITNSLGYHAKGYLFEHETHDTLIIGSSNLTASAMKVNHEWNIKVSSLNDGEIVRDVKQTINETWDSSVPLTEEWILRYELRYKEKQFLEVIEEDNEYREQIVPNKMQVEALKGIEEVRKAREKRALLVSATGTGKTYLSAFDVKYVNPKRFLFVVHREQILRNAIESFQRVIGNPIHEYGILSGTSKDKDKKYLFSTIQSLSMDKHLETYAKDEFDYIVIDEVHRSGADSYLKVINYFEPKFLLGMTATPERPDNINIFELFDYNVAYEIRLQDALEEDLICPFHYYGVTDYIKDGEALDDTTELRYLVSDERIDYLVEKMEYYGHDGKQVCGLIFTSLIEEAEEVSSKLNERGYRTKYLTGDHSNDVREETIRDLENGVLEYIVTVGIFNEGIDIPSINQVIMMRETKSSIIFIQQLGRGLRLHPSKEFVTIIDYIGNYKNNYLIPIALSGDNSLDKEVIRRKMLDTSYISGVSTINFEKVAKERIFSSITDTKIDSASNLKKSYNKLKNRLGRIPMLSDFYSNDLVNPIIISNYNESYYGFLLKYEEKIFSDNSKLLNDYAQRVLRLFSAEYLNGKRLHETFLILYLLENKYISYPEIESMFSEESLFLNEFTVSSVINSLSLNFFGEVSNTTYPTFPILNNIDDKVSLSEEMNILLENKVFKFYFEDILKTSLLIGRSYQQDKQLTVGKLYTRRDASLLLNWEKNRAGVINGYMYNTRTNTLPVFITYHKKKVSDSIDYKDKFLSRSRLRMESKNNRKMNSPDVKVFLNSEEIDVDILVFVQRDKKTDDKEFYYLGKASFIKGSEFMSETENGLPVVVMDFELEDSVEESLFRYITSKELSEY